MAISISLRWGESPRTEISAAGLAEVGRWDLHLPNAATRMHEAPAGGSTCVSGHLI